MSARALVFGGGGAAGNAWEIGVVAGLFEAGLDPMDADLVLGTSAGSTAAVQLAGTADPIELLEATLAPAPAPPRPRGGQGANPMERLVAIIDASEDAAGMRRRLGAAALQANAATDPAEQSERRAVVAARLPSQEWPDGPIRIAAIDAHTGEPLLFGRDSGVAVADAVTASCAHALMSPFLHTVGGRSYIDGGHHSATNADLAAGHERVLVLAPLGHRALTPPAWRTDLVAHVEDLEAAGSRVETVSPDDASRAAFGTNMMDPSTRPSAARAGADQGRALAGRLRY